MNSKFQVGQISASNPIRRSRTFRFPKFYAQQDRLARITLNCTIMIETRTDSLCEPFPFSVQVERNRAKYDTLYHILDLPRAYHTQDFVKISRQSSLNVKTSDSSCVIVLGCLRNPQAVLQWLCSCLTMTLLLLCSRHFSLGI